MYALTRSLVNRVSLIRQVQLLHISAATPTAKPAPTSCDKPPAKPPVKPPARPGKIKIALAPLVDKNEGYDVRNMRLKRVLSPSLGTYKPQITSFLSFTHRGTGIWLSMYALTLGFGALVSPHDSTTLLSMIQDQELDDNLLLATKYLMVWPFAYHALNGIRHFCWDSGNFLKLKEVYSTGYIMITSSWILAGILTAL